MKFNDALYFCDLKLKILIEKGIHFKHYLDKVKEHNIVKYNEENLSILLEHNNRITNFKKKTKTNNSIS